MLAIFSQEIIRYQLMNSATTFSAMKTFGFLSSQKTEWQVLSYIWTLTKYSLQAKKEHILLYKKRLSLSFKEYALHIAWTSTYSPKRVHFTETCSFHPSMFISPKQPITTCPHRPHSHALLRAVRTRPAHTHTDGRERLHTPADRNKGRPHKADTLAVFGQGRR